MIILTPEKTRDFDPDSIKNIHKKDTRTEYFEGLAPFAQELNRRIEEVHKNNKNQVESKNKIESKKIKNVDVDKTKSLKDKKKNKISNDRINNEKHTKENLTGKKYVKEEHKTAKELLAKRLKKINRWSLYKNKIKDKKGLKSKKSKVLKKPSLIQENMKSKNLKAEKNALKKILSIKEDSAKSKLASIVKKSSIKNGVVGKVDNSIGDINGIKLKAGGKRKINFSNRKVKLHLKGKKQIQHNRIVKIDNSISNDSKKENTAGKSSIKDLNINFKDDALLVSKKYDFNIPEVATKTNNLIYRSADEIFGEIVKHFTFIVNRGGGEAKLSLYPPELGKIKMNIKLQNGKVSTFFLVDNQAVKEIIDARLNILQQNLIDQGFSLGSFDVGVRDESANLDNFKSSERGLKGEGNVLFESIPDIAEIPDEAVNQAVLPWLSSYINITV